MKRIATAAVLIPTVLWVVFVGPPWAFTAFTALLGAAAFFEFDGISMAHGNAGTGLPGFVAGLLFLLSPNPFFAVMTIALTAMVLALRVPDLSKALSTAGALALGVVYTFGPWRSAAILRQISPHWLMIALLVCWIGDTAAMYTGKAMGKHKLAPRISPGKTWEGTLGSILGSGIACVVYAHFFLPSAHPFMVLGIAFAGNIAGQIGDLSESAIKRGAGMKDSGTMLPGHGGWLDRLDSVLFSIPVVHGIVQVCAIGTN